MIARIHRFSKAIATFAVPAAVVVADVAGQVSDVTTDDTIVADEWKLLLFGVVAAVVTALAPKNAEPS